MNPEIPSQILFHRVKLWRDTRLLSYLLAAPAPADCGFPGHTWWFARDTAIDNTQLYSPEWRLSLDPKGWYPALEALDTIDARNPLALEAVRILHWWATQEVLHQLDGVPSPHPPWEIRDNLLTFSFSFQIAKLWRQIMNCAEEAQKTAAATEGLGTAHSVWEHYEEILWTLAVCVGRYSEGSTLQNEREHLEFHMNALIHLGGP